MQPPLGILGSNHVAVNTNITNNNHRPLLASPASGWFTTNHMDRRQAPISSDFLEFPQNLLNPPKSSAFLSVSETFFCVVRLVVFFSGYFVMSLSSLSFFPPHPFCSPQRFSKKLSEDSVVRVAGGLHPTPLPHQRLLPHQSRVRRVGPPGPRPGDPLPLQFHTSILRIVGVFPFLSFSLSFSTGALRFKHFYFSPLLFWISSHHIWFSHMGAVLIFFTHIFIQDLSIVGL